MTEFARLQTAISKVRNQATQLRDDSRAVAVGDIFFALPGEQTDGRLYIAQALDNGAALVIAQAGEQCAAFAAHPRVCISLDAQAVQGDLAKWFYGNAGDALRLIGVTGTNGKTSVAVGIAAALEALGIRCGVMGTLGAGVFDKHSQGLGLSSFGLTTPTVINTNRLLQSFAQQGAAFAVMEVSSIALVQGRCAGLPFKLAAFTNLSQDHLDFHGTMENYQAAKAQLFACESLSAAVVQNSVAGLAMARVFAKAQPQGKLYWTSLTAMQPIFIGDVCVSKVSAQAQSLSLKINEQDVSICTAGLGEAMQANALTIAACLSALGFTAEKIAQAMRVPFSVPGRMNVIAQTGKPTVVIDYAHTPDGIENLLQSLAPQARAQQGKLKILFGAGGDRDALKRPLMGQLASKWADEIVISNDNPRRETPELIAAQILRGVESAGKTAKVNLNRAAAITELIAQSSATDVIALAGLGADTEQIIGSERHPHSDSASALAALANWTQP